METLDQPRSNNRDIKDFDGGDATKKDLIAIIDRLARRLTDGGERFSSSIRRLGELRERLAEERFHLAVLGQFKRGKSTLINALLGESLLPTSILPLTSIPTLLSAGPNRRIAIVFQDGKREEFADLTSDGAAEILATYVTEERNPHNRLAVSRVEVDHPSPLLRSGAVLIDTPGIGSTLRHNTETTLAFLPQCDAALFVVSADPPITDVEVEFLKAVQARLPRVFFVMNKIDHFDAGEIDRAVDFFSTTVGPIRQRNGVERIFRISARQGSLAKLAGDESLWRQSGMADLESGMMEFFRREKSHTLRFALAGKARDCAADAVLQIRLQRRSLQMPIDDLERRIQLLDAKIMEAENERLAISDLMAGERTRAVHFLEEQADAARQKAGAHLGEVIAQALQGTVDSRLMERTVQERLAEEIPVFFDEILRALTAAIAHRVGMALKPFEVRTDRLMEGVRRAAAELFDIPYQAPESARALESAHKPYWITRNWDSLIRPIPEGWTDRFLPAAVRRRRISRRLNNDAAALSLRNVENVRWSMLRNLDDAFRRFSQELDRRLEETIQATRGAVHAARLRRSEILGAIDTEFNRLEQIESELSEIEKALATISPPKGDP